jgi:hypothetical protein
MDKSPPVPDPQHLSELVNSLLELVKPVDNAVSLDHSVPLLNFHSACRSAISALDL